ncbi:MAG: hypothetical protein AMXMBFR47_14180 [Planctomycetota bacterium]
MRQSLALALLSLGACLTCSADPVHVFDQEGGSWASNWYWVEPGAIDFFAVEMITAGDEFASPAMEITGRSGWTSSNLSNTLGYATGSTVGGTYYWTFHLADPQYGNPFSFQFAAFAGATRIASYVFNYDGAGTWSLGDSSWNPDRSNLVVPVPSAVLLGALGLGMAGWAKRRAA